MILLSFSGSIYFPCLDGKILSSTHLNKCSQQCRIDLCNTRKTSPRSWPSALLKTDFKLQLIPITQKSPRGNCNQEVKPRISTAHLDKLKKTTRRTSWSRHSLYDSHYREHPWRQIGKAGPHLPEFNSF